VTIPRRSQDENHVILIVRTPHVKAEELDLEVSHYGFKLYVRPYFLSLTFKQPLAEDGKETASWDVGKGLVGFGILPSFHPFSHP
jgi:protein SHQ1